MKKSEKGVAFCGRLCYYVWSYPGFFGKYPSGKIPQHLNGQNAHL
jgi:hypothetical protein